MATANLSNRRGETLESYPMTPVQEGMLYHSLRAPQAGFEVQQMVGDLEEALDSPAFLRAWQLVAARHPALRTRFNYAGLHGPIQEVVSEFNLAWVEQDWSDFSDSRQREEAFTAFLEADRTRGFDFAEAPPQRFTLLRFSPSAFRFVWTFHHALLDGRSIVIVLRDVFALYQSILDRDQLLLPAPSLYRDHVGAIADQTRSKTTEAFWRKQLGEFNAPTPLVVERARGPNSPNRRGELQTMLSASLTDRLRVVTRTAGVTMNTLVQGAWALLLNRYSGEHDVVFGATRACRHSTVEGAESMVGVLINTLPIRVLIDPEMKLQHWLKELRQQGLALRPVENTSLVKVQSWSDVPPAQPLFESLVVFEKFQLNELLRSGDGPWTRRRFRLLEQPGYALTLAAYDGPDLWLKVFFDRQRFDESTIERMLGHLTMLLGGMAGNPEGRLRDLALVTPGERQSLLTAHQASRVRFAAEHCLHDLFTAQSERTPSAVAVAAGDEFITYSDLNDRTDLLAAELQGLGIGPESMVAICCEPSIDAVVGIIGILKAGAAYVPIDPTCPPERLSFLLEDTLAPVILVDRARFEALPDLRARKLCLDSSSLKRKRKRTPKRFSRNASPENAAYVIYTSGSTGKPKGVIATHHNVARLFRSTQPWFRFGQHDVWTLFHSLAFDFSVWELWGALLHGGKLVIVPHAVSRSPQDFLDLLVQERVTVLNQTPSAFRLLDEAESRATPCSPLALRLVIFGGEALEVAGLKTWFDRHGDRKPQLVNMYGITETTVHVTYRPLTRADLDGGSVIGRPIPDLELFVLDENREPVPILVPGELYVGGEGVTRGYLNRPDLTAERFVQHPFVPSGRIYRTGDRARFLDNGDVEYLGRLDDQVKIRGFRIEPGEIQAVLRKHPLIKDAVVMVREGKAGDKRLVAYVVARGSPKTDELHAFVKERLPDYMVPSTVVLLDCLPLTRNGKVDRRALPAPEIHCSDSKNKFVAPRTDLERTIAVIWQELLGTRKVGLHDNFFEMGGHSLLLVQLHYRLETVLGRTVPITTLFQFPTISVLTRHLDAVPDTHRGKPNKRVQRMRELQEDCA